MAKKLLTGQLNPSWDFKNVKTLEGKYLGMKRVEGDNGPRKVYTIEKNDGAKIDVWGSAIIDSAMLNVDEGDFIGFEFKGMTKNKKGRPLNSFDVYLLDEEPEAAAVQA